MKTFYLVILGSTLVVIHLVDRVGCKWYNRGCMSTLQEAGEEILKFGDISPKPVDATAEK